MHCPVSGMCVGECGDTTISLPTKTRFWNNDKNVVEIWRCYVEDRDFLTLAFFYKALMLYLAMYKRCCHF
uniref:Uncharacterized protein n=1 Tax=Anguilla anguilla TaxID=7936 RepID=A0A0E9TJD2_ANGAN